MSISSVKNSPIPPKVIQFKMDRKQVVLASCAAIAAVALSQYFVTKYFFMGYSNKTQTNSTHTAAIEPSEWTALKRQLATLENSNTDLQDKIVSLQTDNKSAIDSRIAEFNQSWQPEGEKYKEIVQSITESILPTLTTANLSEGHQELVNKLSTDLSTLQQEFVALKAGLEAHDTTLTARFNNIKGTVSSLQAELNAVKERLGDTDVANLQSQLTALQTLCNELEKQQTELPAAVFDKDDSTPPIDTSVPVDFAAKMENLKEKFNSIKHDFSTISWENTTIQGLIDKEDKNQADIVCLEALLEDTGPVRVHAQKYLQLKERLNDKLSEASNNWRKGNSEKIEEDKGNLGHLETLIGGDTDAFDAQHQSLLASINAIPQNPHTQTPGDKGNKIAKKSNSGVKG